MWRSRYQMEVSGQLHAPTPLSQRNEKTFYPLNKRERERDARNLLPLLGIEP